MGDRAQTETLPKYPNTLHEWIKRRRYKVKTLADKTDIPLRSMWNYIRGQAVIPEDRLAVLAEHLGCRPEELLPRLFIWNVPHQRNPFFTGREVLLQHIHEILNRENAVALTYPQALCGLGASGKRKPCWSMRIAITASTKRFSG